MRKSVCSPEERAATNRGKTAFSSVLTPIVHVLMCFDRLMVLIVDSAKYKEDSIDELNRFINNEVLKFLIEDYLSEIEECEKILNDIRKREGGEKLLRHFRIQ